MSTEFPAEFFIEIAHHDHLLGRLIVNQMIGYFWVEIDLVLKESKKIFKHVGDLRALDLDEATYQGVQVLANFLK